MTEKTKFNDSKTMNEFLLEISAGNLESFNYKPEKMTPQGINLELVTSYGGEGEGDLIGYVLKVTEGSESVHVRVEGSYDSYNGSEWEYANVHLVEPRQVEVTQYFPIKN